jgi:hypothetical protein
LYLYFFSLKYTKLEGQGGSRKHIEELYNRYSPARIIRMIKSMRMRWVMHGKKKIIYRISVEKPGVKRPLVRPRPMWEDNIKIRWRWCGLE